MSILTLTNTDRAENSQLSKKMATVLQRLETLESEVDSDRIATAFALTTVGDAKTSGARPKTTSDLL